LVRPVVCGGAGLDESDFAAERGGMTKANFLIDIFLITDSIPL
jgi:hypothetical protein